MINESTIYLWATETFVSDGDDLTIWQLVRLLESRRRGSGLHLLLKVQGDVGQLLLDVTNDFALGGGGERVTTLSQDLCKRQNIFLKKSFQTTQMMTTTLTHHVVSQIATGQIQTQDGVWQGITYHPKNANQLLLDKTTNHTSLPS